uniref:Uncharacterized protein n=1 Tax=Bionectria ochroleuca TaxID=29856 RepID=A0A0B7KS02_BIOOC
MAHNLELETGLQQTKPGARRKGIKRVHTVPGTVGSTNQQWANPGHHDRLYHLQEEESQMKYFYYTLPMLARWNHDT